MMGSLERSFDGFRLNLLSLTASVPSSAKLTSTQQFPSELKLLVSQAPSSLSRNG
jgi:hypothetical protein